MLAFKLEVMRKINALFLSIILLGCEEPYTIEQQQVDTMVVIEGLVTNETKQHLVKISTTTDFYAVGATPSVSNAEVRVEDSEGNIFQYDEDPDLPGHYFSEAFSGVEDRTYRLTVTIQDQQYIAEETLYSVTPIDSLSYFLDEDEREYLEDNDDNSERYYQVQFYTKEPPETEDYYLFKFYRDNVLMNGEGEDVYYSDDEFLQENIEGVSFNDWYRLGEMASMEMYSISREAYLFYSDVDLTLNNDGGLFSPLPTNPRTNMSNGAMGYFQVSAMVSDSIAIQ